MKYSHDERVFSFKEMKKIVKSATPIVLTLLTNIYCTIAAVLLCLGIFVVEQQETKTIYMGLFAILLVLQDMRSERR